MAKIDQVPRQLIIADKALTADSLIRAAQPGVDGDEEAGLTVEQPSMTNTLIGDIRPTISGDPDRAYAGTLHTGAAGVTGNARWTFEREGDDATTDCRFRQRPGVFGKRIDSLYHSTLRSPAIQHPKLVELTDGRVLLLAMNQTLKFWEYAALPTWPTSFEFSRLDPATDTWSTLTTATGLGDYDSGPYGYTQGPAWTCFDMVVYPDTGEVVCVVMGLARSSATIPAGAIYASVDGGESWTLRDRMIFQGPAGLPAPALGTRFISCAAELTATGRLVVLAATAAGIYSYTSDNRGRTFTAQTIDDGWLLTYQSADGTAGVNRQCMDMHRMRNGTILAYHVRNAEIVATAKPVDAYFYMTVDGSSWTEVQDPDIDNTYTGIAVLERPDGYPILYGILHDVLDPNFTSTGISAQFDEIVAQVFERRDPLPSGAFVNERPPIMFMHPLKDAFQGGAAAPNAPAGLFTDLTPLSLTIDGFCQIATVLYRGQALHVVGTNDDTNGEYGLAVYRSEFMQPIQENLTPHIDITSFGAGILRVHGGYHRAWDCYADPGNRGYANISTGGTGAVQVPNAEGGYFETTVAGAQNYWTDTTLPSALTSYTGLLRFCFRINDGGSTTLPEVAALMVLGVGGPTYAGAVLNFNVNGNDVEVQLADAHGANVGAVATIIDGKSEWIEVILAQWEIDNTSGPTINVAAWWRPFFRSTDTDWMVGFEQIAVGTLTTTATSTERVSFGHIAANSTGEADWKSVAIWREYGGGANRTVPYPIVQQRPFTYRDNAAINILESTGQRGVINDGGVYNFLRTPQMISYPPQFIDAGLEVSWRGEAIADGSVDFGTRYVYAARHLFDGSPMQQEWRSASDAVDIELVLDAEQVLGANAFWDVGAIAVFGKNWHTVRVEFNGLDSWGAPAVSLRAGIPGVTTPPVIDRGTHLLDLVNGVGGSTIAISRFQAKLATASSTARGGALMRPRRFASSEGGPTYYAVFVDQPGSGRRAMFRIVDNTRDTLYFATDPIAYGVSSLPSRIAIVSDRMAWDFRPTLEGLHAGAFNTRYMRILIEAAEHADAAEQFMKTGSIIIGHATRIGPGIEYGFGFSRQAGSRIIEGQSGASWHIRDHGGRRSWSMSSPGLRAAQLPNAVTNADINQAFHSWQRVVDALTRVEINGEQIALVMDGNAAEGSATSSAGEPILTDPYDCALVRLTTFGEVSQLGYLGQVIPRAGTGTTACTPAPVAQVTSIGFTETL